MREFRFFYDCEINDSYQNRHFSKLTFIMMDYKSKFRKYDYSGVNLYLAFVRKAELSHA